MFQNHNKADKILDALQVNKSVKEYASQLAPKTVIEITELVATLILVLFESIGYL